MLDSTLRTLLDPAVNRVGFALAKRGVTANALTWLGFAFGLAAAAAIVAGAFMVALGLFLAGRVLDGLDGAVARVKAKTDYGGYLDIVLDFCVYAAIPLAFALRAPATDALPAAILLASFLANGAAFLAYAIMVDRKGAALSGPKSFYFLTGLAEGGETILVFSLMCLFPEQFFLLAYVFAALCALSAVGRIGLARLSLR